MSIPPVDSQFLWESLIKARWRQQALEETLGRHAGFRNLLRLLWQQGKASLKHHVRQLYHGYFSGLPKRMREQQRLKNPNFKPYVMTLPPAQPVRQRVLHAIPTFGIGGSQQLIVDIIEGTSDRFEHQIITLNDWGWQSYTGVPVRELPSVRNTATVRAILEEFRPDILHVHYWGHQENGYAHWQWYHYVFHAGFEYGCQVIENCNNPLVPYLHSKISSYVYVSEYARDYFGVPSPRNAVIYPGSNFSLFTRPVDESLPVDTIGMVYRLDQDKLNAEAIEVFIKVVQLRPQTKVIIVGSGYFYEHYQQRVAECGLTKSFEFTGMISYQNLPAQYRRLSLFVAPVHKESFGQVTPFAMNMSIPVVGYEIGALPEILVNRMALAPPGDSTALANHIVGLLNQPAELCRLGTFNRQRAQQLFGLQAMVEGYAHLYSALLRTEQTDLSAAGSA